jgi:hypothetical protein
MGYITAWFEIHRLERMERRDEWEHIDWLEKNHPFPIYMQKKLKRFPNSIAYPYREVTKQIGWDKRLLFSCTHSHMMGFAVLEEYEKISLHGVNLMNATETYLEKPAFCLWLGYALSKGIEVDISNSPKLLPEVHYGTEERMGDFHIPYSVRSLTQYSEWNAD